MDIKYYPDQPTVETAITNDDPLLVLVAMNLSEMLVSNIDDAMEHMILLRKLNYRETRIDEFFRVVLNRQGADWTFVCPSEYQQIKNRSIRIETFYSSGIEAISIALKLLGYDVSIKIPDRYRRHFNTLAE